MIHLLKRSKQTIAVAVSVVTELTVCILLNAQYIPSEFLKLYHRKFKLSVTCQLSLYRLVTV